MTHHMLHVQIEYPQVVDDYGTLVEPAEVYRSIVCSGYDEKHCTRSLHECDCPDPDEDPQYEWADKIERGTPEYDRWHQISGDYQDKHPVPGWHTDEPPVCWEAHWADPSECDFDPITQYWAYVQGYHPVHIEIPGWADTEDQYVDVIYAGHDPVDRGAEQ